MEQAATPSILSKACLTSLSAIKRMRARSASPVKPNLMMGSWLGSYLRMTGLVASLGRRSRSSFSLSFRVAKSMLVCQANSTVTSESSARETEEMRTTLSTTPQVSSIGLEMMFSISEGAVPGYSVRMVRVG